MDHHFLPSGPTAFEIQVPYVCEPAKNGVYEPYDGGDFMTYPSRINKEWLLPPAEGKHLRRLDSFLERRKHFTSTDEQQTILQSWAFFGLLSAFLRNAYSAADYIEERDGEVFITTKLLTSRMAAAWEARGAHTTPEQRQEQFVRAARCIRAVSDVLQICREDFDWRIRLSMTSVLELFSRSINQAYNVAWTQAQGSPTTLIISHFPNVQIRTEMIADGWCPSEVSALSMRHYSLQTTVFLSRLNKRRWGGARDHSGCSDSRCLAYQIDLGTYQTAHTTEDCKCVPLPVDLEAIRSILDTHALPVLEVSGLNTSTPHVRIVPSDGKQFVAISHVWADGLGNPVRNELPTCQVVSLGHQVAALQKHTQSMPDLYTMSLQDTNEAVVDEGASADSVMHIWIDTICCPISPVEAKTKSILRMRETYTSAAHVLVLDNGLQSLSFKEMHPIEALLSVFSSAWMQRLWTLQEGSLPRSLWVQFADTPVALDHLYANVVSRRLTDVRLMCLVQDAGNIWAGLRQLQHPQITNTESGLNGTLNNLDRSLLQRSVSYAADEPLCIATLLGLPPETALAGALPSVESRMAALWRAIANSFPGHTTTGLPQKMVLLNYPRLQTKGFRWAPRTLLQPGAGMRIIQWKDPAMGQVTERGFEVRYRAIRLALEWRDSNALAAASSVRPDLRLGISFHVAGERCVVFLNDGVVYARSAYTSIPTHDQLVGADLAVLLVHSVNPAEQEHGGVGEWLALLVRAEPDSAAQNKAPPLVEILCPLILNGRSPTFGPLYDGVDEVIERASKRFDEVGGDPNAVIQDCARELLRERHELRRALETLHNSSDEERLVEVLRIMAAGGVRYRVARAEMTGEETWCIS